jgi:hypothetical protein
MRFSRRYRIVNVSPWQSALSLLEARPSVGVHRRIDHGMLGSPAPSLVGIPAEQRPYGDHDMNTALSILRPCTTQPKIREASEMSSYSA